VLNSTNHVQSILR